MLNKFILGYLVKRLWKLVRSYGMQAILVALVELTDDFNDDRGRRLNRDLRAALTNYRNR